MSVILLIAFTFSAFSLDQPVKVDLTYSASTQVAVEVEVVDYGNNSQVEYTQDLGNITSNSSGILSFYVGVGQESWEDDLAIGDIDNQWVLNIKINDNLYAQYSLKNLIAQSASSGSVNEVGDEIGALATRIVFEGEEETRYTGDDLNTNHPDGTILFLYNSTGEGLFEDGKEDTFGFNASKGLILMKANGNWYVVGTSSSFGFLPQG